MSRTQRGGESSWRSWDSPAIPGRELGQRLLRVWRRTTLLTRFTLTGLLLTILIGSVLGVTVGRYLRESALMQAAERTAESVAIDIDPLLHPEDFAGVPSPERFQEIDRQIRKSLNSHRIVKINLWNPSMVVIYSTDPALLGQKVSIDDELRDALNGEVGMDISDLSKEENRAERSRYSQLMEIYVPIRLGGDRVMGAYEVYRDVNGIMGMIAATQRLLWIGLAVGLTGLYLALFGVVRSASRRLHRQSEELANLEARRVANQLTTEFVSVVSHELRTPLTALVGFSELLLAQPVDPGDQREWIENMHAAAKRLTKLVEDLLDVSRIEEGRVELKRQPLYVKALVKLVLADFRMQTSTHRFEEQYRDPLPPLLADLDKLTQVLTNLISNAVKYSPQGGAITISVTAADGSVRLSVADQGLGLPPEELARIFERFHRVQREDRQQIPGTGLGLYITKRLVELQDGRIWAESAGPGRGSTFHVELPAAAEEKENG